ncbi:MAG: hypothetical protein WAM69_09180 [Candidatus Sulfotelmatobacter sp.]
MSRITSPTVTTAQFLPDFVLRFPGTGRQEKMKVSRQLTANVQNAGHGAKIVSEFSVISRKTRFATKAIHNAVEAIAIPLQRNVIGKTFGHKQAGNR